MKNPLTFIRNLFNRNVKKERGDIIAIFAVAFVVASASLVLTAFAISNVGSVRASVSGTNMDGAVANFSQTINANMYQTGSVGVTNGQVVQYPQIATTVTVTSIAAYSGNGQTGQKVTFNVNWHQGQVTQTQTKLFLNSSNSVATGTITGFTNSDQNAVWG
jgi:acyl-coenzyme A synthetase/AMP-(fatty) acid ligase